MDMTLVIPTRNRRELLGRTLRRVRDALGDGVEVLVFDDACEDGTSEMVRREHPRVRVMRSERMVGYVAARNAAFRACGSDFIFSLDDDSWPMDGRAVEIAREVFPRRRECAFLAANIFDAAHPHGALDETGEPFDVRNFVGCGFVVRREAFLELGGFRAVSPYGGEEMEIALRAHAAGMATQFVPRLRVFHERTPQNRDEAFELRSGLCNAMSFSVLNEPSWYAAAHVAGLGARGTIFAAKRGHPMAPFAGIRDFAQKLPSLLAGRKPVGWGAFRGWRRLPACPP